MLNFIEELDLDEPEKNYKRNTPVLHRKTFAQFFTPYPIANLMAKWLLTNENLNTVLEPAFGLGIFTKCLRQYNKNIVIKAYEVDTHIYNIAIADFKYDEKLQLTLSDYIFTDWGNCYDGIICNPPYFKFQDYDNKNIVNEINTRLNIKLSSFSNLYCSFLVKSIAQLSNGGKAAYLVPSEFLNSDYGTQVKDFLIKEKILRHIFIVDFSETTFDDALTTACILLLAKDENYSNVGFSTIINIDELSKISSCIERYPALVADNIISLDYLNPEIKWRAYYQQQSAIKYKHLVSFSTYAKVSRGIATGANEYFVFNLSKASDHKIKEENLLPCISKSGDVKGTFFTARDFERLKLTDKAAYLLNAKKNNDNYVTEYLKAGEKRDIHKKHLTANRNPWFKLEHRKPSPIWVGVFNRNGLRFIKNEAGISNLSTFHCIYINIFYESKTDLIFAYLLTDMCNEIFNDNKREYGNGLQKFEPNDLNKALIVDLSLITEEQETQILSRYHEYRNSCLSGSPNLLKLEEIDGCFRNIFVL